MCPDVSHISNDTWQTQIAGQQQAGQRGPHTVEGIYLWHAFKYIHKYIVWRDIYRLVGLRVCTRKSDKVFDIMCPLPVLASIMQIQASIFFQCFYMSAVQINYVLRQHIVLKVIQPEKYVSPATESF